MKQATCPPPAALWLFCALVIGFSPHVLGQHALPPLFPSNDLNFTIPFEIEGAASVIREVELFVSQDRGRHWQFVARQPVESGRFAFRADADGEYWFAFRTITSTGITNPTTGHPDLRVLVNTGNPVVASPPPPSSPPPLNEPRQVVPPRPERFRPENTTRPLSQSQTQSAQLTGAEEPKTGEPRPGTANTDRPGQILAPRFPGFELPEPGKHREGDLLGDLLSGMSPFMEIQPVATRSVPNNLITADGSNTAPSFSNVSPTPSLLANAPAGSIAAIDLNIADTRPQIVVKWNTGPELWRDAQIDILRSNTKEGQWLPIAINLPNSGEYWWYLSPEDLKPFYVAVRIRSAHAGSSVDITQSRIEIEIDPRLAVFQGQRP